MSRYYEMSVEIRGYNNSYKTNIVSAAEEEWNFDNWYEHENYLNASGQSNLCGGEGEDEFATRLAKAIWKANGGFCNVEIIATYLEDLPYENYTFDEDEYNRLNKKDEQT
jgi:hypothetical protein